MKTTKILFKYWNPLPQLTLHNKIKQRARDLLITAADARPEEEQIQYIIYHKHAPTQQSNIIIIIQRSVRGTAPDARSEEEQIQYMPLRTHARTRAHNNQTLLLFSRSVRGCEHQDKEIKARRQSTRGDDQREAKRASKTNNTQIIHTLEEASDEPMNFCWNPSLSCRPYRCNGKYNSLYSC